MNWLLNVDIKTPTNPSIKKNKTALFDCNYITSSLFCDNSQLLRALELVCEQVDSEKALEQEVI